MFKKYKNNQMAMEALKKGLVVGVVICVLLHVPKMIGDKLYELEMSLRKQFFKA